MTVDEGNSERPAPEIAGRSGPGTAGVIAITIAGLVLCAAVVTATTTAESAPLVLPYRVGVAGLANDGPAGPPVVVEPAAVPRPSGGADGWRELICSYPWPCDEAMRVSQVESGGNAYAVNPGSGACGLFGLYPCTCIDPECNVATAFAKWVETHSFYEHWYRWWN